MASDFLIPTLSLHTQAALIAAVASAIFSWPTVAEAPWTAISAFYASLILSLATVASASQQSIALYRFGAHSQGLVMLQKSLASGTNRGAASRLQIYVWQMPVMLLNISIMLLIVALFILIWDRAAQTIDWTGDMSVGRLTLSSCACTDPTDCRGHDLRRCLRSE